MKKWSFVYFQIFLLITIFANIFNGNTFHFSSIPLPQTDGTITDFFLNSDTEVDTYFSGNSSDGSEGNPYIVNNKLIKGSGSLNSYYCSMWLKDTTRYVIFRDCVFEEASSSSSAGIMLSNGDNVYFERCTIQTVSICGYFNYADNIRITNSSFLPKTGGLFIRNYAGNNMILNNSLFQIDVPSSSENEFYFYDAISLTFHNNTIQRTGTTHYFNNYFYNCDYLVFSNNTQDYTRTFPTPAISDRMSITSGTNICIENNTLQGLVYIDSNIWLKFNKNNLSTYTMLYLAGNQYVEVIGNTINNTFNGGSYFDVISIYSLHHSVIRENIVNFHYGIDPLWYTIFRVEYFSNLTIANNTIKSNNKTTGFYFGDEIIATGLVCNNTIEGTNMYFEEFTVDNLVVDNNTVNGLPHKYMYNQHDVVINTKNSEAYTLVGCDNVTFSNLEFNTDISSRFSVSNSTNITFNNIRDTKANRPFWFDTVKIANMTNIYSNFSDYGFSWAKNCFNFTVKNSVFDPNLGFNVRDLPSNSSFINNTLNIRGARNAEFEWCKNTTFINNTFPHNVFYFMPYGTFDLSFDDGNYGNLWLNYYQIVSDPQINPEKPWAFLYQINVTGNVFHDHYPLYYNRAPFITSPSNLVIRYENIGEYSINWTVTDLIPPNPQYTVYINDVFYVTGSWSNGTPINVPLSILPMNDYTYRIEVTDGEFTVTDEVLVTVRNDLPTIDAITDTINIEYTSKGQVQLEWEVTDIFFNNPWYEIYQNGELIQNTSMTTIVPIIYLIPLNITMNVWTYRCTYHDGYDGVIYAESIVTVLNVAPRDLSINESIVVPYGYPVNIHALATDYSINKEDAYIRFIEVESNNIILEEAWNGSTDINFKIIFNAFQTNNSYKMVVYDGISLSSEIFMNVTVINEDPTVIPIESTVNVYFGLINTIIGWNISDLSVKYGVYSVLVNDTVIGSGRWYYTTKTILYSLPDDLVLGTYIFQLSVRDGLGSEIKSNITVIVTEAPPDYTVWIVTGGVAGGIGILGIGGYFFNAKYLKPKSDCSAIGKAFNWKSRGCA